MSKLLQRKVFFPWEQGRVWIGARARVRLRFLVMAVLGLMFLLVLRTREERAAAIRATRAAIGTAYQGIRSYRAEHRGGCPRDVGELTSLGYVARLPVDAWGRPLRLVCPGRRDPQGVDVLSDGPDGLPYGLDRVE